MVFYNICFKSNLLDIKLWVNDGFTPLLKSDVRWIIPTMFTVTKALRTEIKNSWEISVFANKLIKSLLGQAAHIAKIYNPEIRDYYQRLISKGKKPQVALNNVKNKLIRIIVALVRKKVPYDQNTYKYYEEREVIERKKNEKLIYC